MGTVLLALLISVVSGLRSLSAPAAVSWGARLGWLDLDERWLAWLGSGATTWILTALAVGELVVDQLPSTPTRKATLPFAARLLSGALCGAALGSARGALTLGLVLGVVGAVIGTLGGAALRARLAAAFGRDRPAALLEDVLAVGGALLIVAAA